MTSWYQSSEHAGSTGLTHTASVVRLVPYTHSRLFNHDLTMPVIPVIVCINCSISYSSPAIGNSPCINGTKVSVKIVKKNIEIVGIY